MSYQCAQANIGHLSRKEIHITALLSKRSIELAQQLEQIQSSITKITDTYNGLTYDKLDSEALLNWGTKVKSLLERMGAQSARGMDTAAERMKQMRAVSLAAKEDFEGGHLVSFRNLVEAEVFGSELDQARELLSSGYLFAATIIAGVVLETTVRNLCTDHGLTMGSSIK